MARLISAQETARRLGVSVEDVTRLVSQEILRPAQATPAGYLFQDEDIERIATNREPTIYDEAAQVGVQIQQEVAHSVSSLQQLWRRAAILSGLITIAFLLSVTLMTASFKLYPRQTSDFFGYYYRFNAGNDSELFNLDTSAFGQAGTTVTPGANNTSVSLTASLVKPIAAVSLLVVKATDGQQYKQIIEPPTASAGAPGAPGSPGHYGVNGLNGQPGPSGLSGPVGQNGPQGTTGSAGAAGADGINGTSGTNGTDGTNGANGTNGVDGMDGINGINGIDGTSVADVATTAGDIIIRNSSNVTDRLGAGSDGQVLTINGGLPAWMDATGLTAEADTLASVTGRGASTSANLLLSGNLTFSGSVTMPGLTSCSALSTNSSGIVQCGSIPARNAAAFTDTSPATDAENNTTKLFNDTTQPSITPSSTSQPILVSVHVRFTASGNMDTYAAARIVRNAGSPASCSGGIQVGDTISAFLSNNNDTVSASDTFLDYPAATGLVYYTVCSSANSDLRSIPVTNRIDVSLVGIN